MEKLRKTTLIVLLLLGQHLFANCIYHADCGDVQNCFPWNDQTYVILNRAGFPSLENGRTYTIVYSYKLSTDGTGPNGCIYTDTIHAVYSCNLGDSEMQDIMGYVDDGTLADWDESAGFFHIIQDANPPFDPEDPSYNDWEPENPGLPSDFAPTLTFHFEFSLAEEISDFSVSIYD